MPRWNITFWDFELFMRQNCQTPAFPTFEINGHVASVSCHYSVIHIIWWNIITDNRFCYNAAVKRHFLWFWAFHVAKTVKPPAAPTFEINRHGALVSCHYSYSHIMWWNINNLAHWQRILLPCHVKTSLFWMWVFLLQNSQTPNDRLLKKLSWGFCVLSLEYYAHKLMKYKQFSPLSTDLITAPR